MPNPRKKEANTVSRISRKDKNSGGSFWNILTILAILGIGLVVVWFWVVFQNPYSNLNPYPPPTLPVAIVLPSATPTQPALPPTWTPAVKATILPTITPRIVTSTMAAVETEMPAPTTFIASTTEHPAPTSTEAPVSLYSFDLQSAPTGIDASVLYPERDCKWMGVGGQVVDLQGRPVTGITVQIGGTMGTRVIDQTSLTGLALKYGEAGYEFEISKQPESTSQSIWVRLIDQARLPLSPKVYFDTYEDCQRNLIIINFRQVR